MVKFEKNDFNDWQKFRMGKNDVISNDDKQMD